MYKLALACIKYPILAYRKYCKNVTYQLHANVIVPVYRASQTKIFVVQDESSVFLVREAKNGQVDAVIGPICDMI